jgi:alkylated DNA repair dioxygenase AlkB
MLLFDETALFDEGKRRYTKFDLPGTELRLWEQFFARGESDHYFRLLKETTPWQQRTRKMYDNWVLDPRLTAWYGGANGLEWTPTLLDIKARVEEQSGIAFNRVLLNFYRDGNDSVAWHSDTLPADGKHHAIGSVTFGETRVFKVRPKAATGAAGAGPGARAAAKSGSQSSPAPRSKTDQLDILLTHGSFLLMDETMQDLYEHHIPKTAKPIGPRINLTFRISDSTKPVYYVDQN